MEREKLNLSYFCEIVSKGRARSKKSTIKTCLGKIADQITIGEGGATFSSEIEKVSNFKNDFPAAPFLELCRQWSSNYTEELIRNFDTLYSKDDLSLSVSAMLEKYAIDDVCLNQVNKMKYPSEKTACLFLYSFKPWADVYQKIAIYINEYLELKYPEYRKEVSREVLEDCDGVIRGFEWKFTNGDLVFIGKGILTVSESYIRTIDEPYIDKETMYCLLPDNIRNNTERIYITTGIEEIGGSSFPGFPNLEAVFFPYGFKRIHQLAFKGCMKLKKVVFPDTLSKIDRQAFMYCTSLTELNLPINCYIDTEAFSGCTSLKSIFNEHGGMTRRGIKSRHGIEIGFRAFDNCCSLSSVQLYHCLSIAEHAFRNCQLDDISLSFPCGGRIAREAFRHSHMVKLTLAGQNFVYPFAPLNGAIFINKTAFLDCNNLMVVVISEGYPIVHRDIVSEESKIIPFFGLPYYYSKKGYTVLDFIKRFALRISAIPKKYFILYPTYNTSDSESINGQLEDTEEETQYDLQKDKGT